MSSGMGVNRRSVVSPHDSRRFRCAVGRQHSPNQPGAGVLCCGQEQTTRAHGIVRATSKRPAQSASAPVGTLSQNGYGDTNDHQIDAGRTDWPGMARGSGGRAKLSFCFDWGPRNAITSFEANLSTLRPLRQWVVCTPAVWGRWWWNRFQN